MHEQTGRALALSAIDFLCCLLLVVLVLIAPPAKKATAIDTLGVYAVTIDWPKGRDDDVDLYTQAPDGSIVFFAHAQGGLMHLEHDDLGNILDEEDGVAVHENSERLVLRGVIPGEYVTNVHAYRRGSRGPLAVTVKLYRLRGPDTLVLTQKIILGADGDEQTAFRFVLNQRAELTGHSRLPKRFTETW